MQTALRGLSILVVEDERSVLRSVSRLLGIYGAAHVHGATTVDSAMGTLVSTHIDVAVVDLNLGETSGITVIRALRTIDGRLPALLTTGGALTEAPLDDCGFLAKPFSGQSLAAAIVECMSERGFPACG